VLESTTVAEDPAPGQSQGGRHSPAESDWNLAQSYLDAGRCKEALPVLEGLFRGFPERLELGHALFQCQLTLNRFPEAAETLEVMLEGLPAGIWSLLPRAELCIAKRDFREARSLVTEAWALHSAHPEQRRLGLSCCAPGWNALEDLAKQALKLDDNDALAWLGLAEAQLRKDSGRGRAPRGPIRPNYYLAGSFRVGAGAHARRGSGPPCKPFKCSSPITARLQPIQTISCSHRIHRGELMHQLVELGCSGGWKAHLPVGSHQGRHVGQGGPTASGQVRS
jgi:hypothetical protein